VTGTTLLRQLTAALGLILLIPIGLQLIGGTVSPTDAAIRAAALFVGVVVARRLAGLAPGGPEVLIPAPSAAVNEGDSRKT